MKGKILLWGAMLAAALTVGKAEGATAGTVSAKVDLRPSIAAFGTDSFHSENSVELNLNVSDTTVVGYLQAFNTNLSGHGGQAEIYAFDGFFRSSYAPLYKSADESLTLSYSNRLYTPTFKARRDAGFITTFRNYLSLSKKVSNKVTVSGSLVPILHAFSRSGSGTGATASANPIFENRLYAIVDFQITDKLTLSLPLMFHQTRYLNYQAGAKNNDAWSLFLWTYPELIYAVSPNLSVGVAYYSDDLLKATGWSKGVGQLTLQASL